MFMTTTAGTRSTFDRDRLRQLANIVFALAQVIGGLIASFVTWRSRGNTAYALTIVWALIGVIVANIVRTPSIQVASVAAIMAVLIVAVLLYARVTRRTHVVL
jgi:CHASE2 domain-containing sensor protein